MYITQNRLPTEKAHGYQISKMCEAFSKLGIEVLLLHPHRHQHNKKLRHTTVFEYYKVRPVFEVRTLPNLDVLLAERFFPRRTFVWFYFLHSLLWGLYAALKARREAVDLYYTRDVAVAFWLVQIGLPTVFEAHVVHRHGQRWLLENIAHHRALALVPVLTPFIKKQLITMGFPKEKMLVSPDAVDLSSFENLPRKEECRRLLNLPLERPIIGYIGRFQTMGMEKGIPELIEAMAHLPSVNGKRPLLLCVGGPMSAVQDYLDRADSIEIPRQTLRFVDHVPTSEVPRVMKACDVCTIPWPWTEFSAYYTSPMKLFEYMAAGVPIVASDLPSLREILRHGENAWLVRPGNPSALADGIRTLLADWNQAQRLAKRAKRDVKIYTWEARAAHIIERILANKDS